MSPTLSAEFATAFPELGVPWQAERAPDPRLLILNEALATELGLDPARLGGPDGVALLTGATPPAGARPVAQVYSGHQFGSYAPRLGDGRALLLGELRHPDGSLRDLHLKGSGRTPFSRGGDGLAAVGPMLREYVIGEAMHALGIPTTRALGVVATGRAVQRESPLPGAVLARVARSHLRVGTFQYAAVNGDRDLLQRLVDHAIARHHPQAAGAATPALGLLEAVTEAQADLVAGWMLVGFVHGVMNTDNMTISGESIDYGPCAFMDAFDPATVFSSIDHAGRYAYGNQPPIAEWNLSRFAETLLPLLDDDQDKAVEIAVEALSRFRTRYATGWVRGMRAKLGLSAQVPQEQAHPLIDDLLPLLAANSVDFTSFFRRLAAAARGDAEPVRGMVLDLAGIDAWLDRWRALQPDPDAMDAVNPVYIPRNHRVEEALDAATDGDLGPLERLVAAVRSPYVERAEHAAYADPAPDGNVGYRTFCGT